MTIKFGEKKIAKKILYIFIYIEDIYFNIFIDNVSYSYLNNRMSHQISAKNTWTRALIIFTIF